jgi:hypothetical protein
MAGDRVGDNLCDAAIDGLRRQPEDFPRSRGRVVDPLSTL